MYSDDIHMHYLINQGMLQFVYNKDGYNVCKVFYFTQDHLKLSTETKTTYLYTTYILNGNTCTVCCHLKLTDNKTDLLSLLH